MIIAYHRPKTLEAVISLVEQPDTYLLGGGTWLTQKKDSDFAVIDLQSLGLNKIRKIGEKLEIGATTLLQMLMESNHTPEALRTAIKLEASLNIRNMGTIAGSLVVGDGRSSFLSLMLVLDSKLILYPDNQVISLGNLLPRRGELLRGKLITKVEIPLNLQLSYNYVARSPVDKPIISVALARWPSGRTRLVLGGWGDVPSLAMDGMVLPTEGTLGLETAARNSAHEASDQWASAEYRSDIAAVLARRCLSE